jgi:WD40 repeat protein
MRSIGKKDLSLLVGQFGPMDFWASSPLTALAFSPDGQMLFAAARTGEVVGYDLKRFMPTWSLKAPTDADLGASLAVSPEGRLLLAPLRRAPAALDVGGKRVKKLGYPPECGEGRCAMGGFGAFFLDQGIAVAGRDSVIVWRHGEEMSQIEHPQMKDGEAFSALAGSQREELLALGTELGRLIVWDVKESKPLKQGGAHSGKVFGAQFLADGKRVATVGADGVLKIWDARKGTMLRSLRLIERAERVDRTPKLGAVGFSPDGRRVMTAAAVHGRDGSELSLWDVESGKRLWRAQDLLTTAIAFSADAKLAGLVVYDRGATEPKRVIVLEVETGPSVMKKQGHQQRITGLSVSPDGKVALSASLDGTIKRWDAASGNQTHVVGTHPKGIYDLAVSWDRQKALSVGTDGAVRQWELKPSEIRGDLGPELMPATPQPKPTDPAPPPHAMAMSGDDRRVLLPLGTQACLVPEGEAVQRCAPGFRLRKWDLQESKPLRDFYFSDRIFSRPPCSVFLPDSNDILVGYDSVDALTGKAGALKLFVRDSEGVPVRSFSDPDSDTLRALVLQPGGDLVLVATDRLVASPLDRKKGLVWLWNWRTGKRVRALDAHTDSVVSATFSGDGRKVLTASLDGTVRLWDVALAKELEQLDLRSLMNDVPSTVALASAGSTLLVGTEKGALLQFQLRR